MATPPFQGVFLTDFIYIRILNKHIMLSYYKQESKAIQQARESSKY